MRSVVIRYDSFHLALDADRLGELPRANIRKILRLARRDYRNEAALQELRQILRENVSEAEAAYAQAKAEYSAGWKWVNKKSRTEASLTTMRQNNRLRDTEKRAKAELIAAKALWEIYQKEIG